MLQATNNVLGYSTATFAYSHTSRSVEISQRVKTRPFPIGLAPVSEHSQLLQKAKNLTHTFATSASSAARCILKSSREVPDVELSDSELLSRAEKWLELYNPEKALDLIDIVTNRSKAIF